MKTLKDRLKTARKRKGYTQGQLAELAGVQQQLVQQLEGGKIKKSGSMVALAKALDISPDWLQFGSKAALDSIPSYQTPVIGSTTDIPLLDWNEITNWCTKGASVLLNARTKFLPRLGNAGPRSYALTVTNDAMLSSRSNTKSFHKGEILVVDPDQEPQENSFIIARTENTKEAIFRQLVRDGGYEYLKPLNSQYSTIKKNKSVKVFGTVICYVGIL